MTSSSTEQETRKNTSKHVSTYQVGRVRKFLSPIQQEGCVHMDCYQHRKHNPKSFLFRVEESNISNVHIPIIFILIVSQSLWRNKNTKHVIEYATKCKCKEETQWNKLFISALYTVLSYM